MYHKDVKYKYSNCLLSIPINCCLDSCPFAYWMPIICQETHSGDRRGTVTGSVLVLMKLTFKWGGGGSPTIVTCTSGI